MKKIILMALFFATFISFSNAQTDATPAPTAEKVRGNGKNKAKAAMSVKKQLGLNDEQAQKMKTIGATFKGKWQAIRTDQSLSKDQKKAQMQEAKTAYDAEVKAVLTPEQYTKWTEMRNQAKIKMKNTPKGKKMNKKMDDDTDDLIPMDGDGQ